MSKALQSKLLRALESGEVRRIGENDSRRVDVRFVAATNVDLKSAIEAGEFRQRSLLPLERPPGAHAAAPGARQETSASSSITSSGARPGTGVERCGDEAWASSRPTTIPVTCVSWST